MRRREGVERPLRGSRADSLTPVATTLTDAQRRARSAADALAEHTGVAHHDVVLVLGSGWAAAADALGEPVADLAVSDLPGFHAPVAEGHLGRVRSYELDGVRVLVFMGRTHLYEGHGPAAVAHSIRTAAAAGCRTAILTSANGSLRADWPAGTGVVLTDHMNLTALSPIELAPLEGASFVDLTDLYTPRLRQLAHDADKTLVDGVYAMLPGPHYETQAEARMIRTLGADVIGMSTVLEAIAARAEGMDVLGLSVVTTIEIGGEPIDPAEVVAVAEAAATRLGSTIARVTSQLDPRAVAHRPDTDGQPAPASPVAQ